MGGPSSNPIYISMHIICSYNPCHILAAFFAEILCLFSHHVCGHAWCSAHARLMFRTEVMLADAIAAVVCVESSMTTSALLDGMGNALHSSFADNPDEECILEQHQVLVLVI